MDHHPLSMDTSENNLRSYNNNGNDASSSSSDLKSDTPAWRKPISTSFSSSLREKLGTGTGVAASNGNSNNNNHNDSSCPVESSLYNKISRESPSRENANFYNNDEQQNESDNQKERMMMKMTSGNNNEDRPVISGSPGVVDVGDDSQTVIQILLPCIICNRTFSPEALERHSKVCTKVNVKSPYKPTRGTFDISEKRKKGTKLEDFIPPPPTFDALTDNRFGFSRNSRSRTSLRGTSCTTRTTLNSGRASRDRDRSVSQSRERSVSTTRTPTSPAPPPPQPPQHSNSTEYPYDDTSEFGSNGSDENSSPNSNLPSYAKPIAPTDICPYCNRSFGIKSYDRHVEFCKELYERRKYEIQPIPKEKEEAMERQELRTKYRPIKGSSSMSSLRSMSPAKDFASMAMKLFGGLRRTEGSANLYFNQLKNNLKKSNESIANSCYGDYTRGIRRPSPSPARGSISSMSSSGNNNKMNNNNLLTKTYLQQHQNQYGYPMTQGNSLLPMRINTSSNIPKLAKSSDSLISGNSYAHVPSSGYGQPPSVLMMNNNNAFSRNSRSRSSLHKNFFRTKRAEPDGTENTSSMSQSPTGGTSPLIISPVNFYSKGRATSSSSALDLTDSRNNSRGHDAQNTMMMMTENVRPVGGSLFTSDPDYDPYEKAAKQLEELLKTSPVKTSKRTSRKMGLEKAFESVGVPSDMSTLGKSKLGRTQSLDYSADPFGLMGGRGRQSTTAASATAASTTTTDPFGLSGMAMTPNIDDSYWDQILRRNENLVGHNQGNHSNNCNNNNNNNNNNSSSNNDHCNNNPETTSSQEESDTSGASGDTAKSRAMSNTSSADSAFSRSEVNDSEFEALESIASIGDHHHHHHLSSSSRNKPSENREDHHPRISKSNDLFSTSSKRNHLTSCPRSPEGKYSFDLTSLSTDTKQKGEANGGGGGGAWAKFCHECGTPYPTVLAKFCPECGEKRVCKV